MGFLLRFNLVLLCLSAWLNDTFLSSQAVSVADVKIEDEGSSDFSTDFTVKDFLDKNQMLLAENTVVLSYLTEESA